MLRRLLLLLRALAIVIAASADGVRSACDELLDVEPRHPDLMPERDRTFLRPPIDGDTIPFNDRAPN
jgi:hypothetical protein